MGIDPPNPAIEVDLSVSATPSAAPAVELNSPCFSATPKEDPGYVFIMAEGHHNQKG